MGGVLPQQFPQGGQFLLLQPLAVPLLIALKGLAGVQRQDTQLRHSAQQVGQGRHPAPDPFLREHGEVIRLDEEKGQLSFRGSDAVAGELADAHELPCGLPLAQLLFLLFIQPLPPIRNTAVSKTEN